MMMMMVVVMMIMVRFENYLTQEDWAKLRNQPIIAAACGITMWLPPMPLRTRLHRLWDGGPRSPGDSRCELIKITSLFPPHGASDFSVQGVLDRLGHTV